MNTTQVKNGFRPHAGDVIRGSFWTAGVLAGAATMYVGGALPGSADSPLGVRPDIVDAATPLGAGTTTQPNSTRPDPTLVAKVRLAALASTIPTSSPASGPRTPAVPTSVWDDLAQCESSGNWSINTGNGFKGGLQFTASTWRQFGGTQYADSAEHASRVEQIAVAQKVQASQGWGAWPVCSKRVHAATARVELADTAVPTHPRPPSVSKRPAAAPTLPAKTQQGGGPGSVTVRPGESLGAIATEHHVDGGWQALFELNKTRLRNPNVIHPGDRLDLPAPSGHPEAARQSDAPTHTLDSDHHRQDSEHRKGDRTDDGAFRSDRDDDEHANPLILTGPPQQERAWITGHTWTPTKKNKNANKLGDPVIHDKPGGIGTFDDPISASVPAGADRVWKVGARFYLPTLKRYAIVEDTGATTPPSDQEGHLDLWLGDRGDGGKGKTAVDQCLDRITQDNAPVELNPPAGRPVTPGPLLQGQDCQVPTHH